MEKRILTVSEMSGFHAKPFPSIRLCGKWLEERGFTVGSKVEVYLGKGEIIIWLAEERQEERL
ncbi:MAG TPA: SymE family type I addiction module toxin [Clostridia bacterium]|nr:SymE family type I addiction module toxin [Clostridia bacterium]